VCRAEPGTVMADDWELTTGDGGVSLYVPDAFDADIDAQTGDGSIRNEFAAEVESTQQHTNHRTFRGQLGSGGKRLKIRTEDGSIRLRRS
jgi:hypothetical protein